MALPGTTPQAASGASLPDSLSRYSDARVATLLFDVADRLEVLTADLVEEGSLKRARNGLGWEGVIREAAKRLITPSAKDTTERQPGAV